VTLVEVIVAVALLGVGISACVACIGSATRASARAEEYTAVQLIAREKLAEIELRGAAEGEDAGDFGPERPGYGWRTVTTTTDLPGVYLVRLTLLWGDPAQPRAAEYVTYVRRL
jgi:Tfp pilus assembly protein PilV